MSNVFVFFSPVSAPIVFDCSPLRPTLSAWHGFRTDVVPSNQRRFEHAESNANMGSAMPVQDFMKNFFPNLPKKYSRERRGVAPWVMDADIVTKIRKAAKSNSEREIASAWAEWSGKKDIHCPCPGYRLSLSQDRWDKGDAEQLKVDGALHPDTAVPKDGRPHWEALCALLEFKAGGTKFDPFDDVKQGDADAQSRIDVRGQLTEYVARAFAYQHRSAMFLFLVNGVKMRATRWDRSGTIFTEAFDYTQDRETLRDIFWGFSRLSPRGQGLDYSAMPLRLGDKSYVKMTKLAVSQKSDISEEEGTIVNPNLKGPYVFKYVRAAFAASIAGDAPRYRLSVPTVKGDRFYLVGKPTIVAAGMSGRGTRGYVAWDVTGKRFVWLKDAWRPIYDNVATEGSVLRTLNSAGVRNVPTYVCDGELDDETETPKWAKPPLEETSNTQGEDTTSEPALRRSKRARNTDPQPTPTHSPNAFINRGKHVMRKFRHYRIIVEEVCMSLPVFKNGKQLVSITRDCVQAHADAVNKTHIHHRDVSAGNILICPIVVRGDDGKLRVVWKGLLTDWELSKPTMPTGRKARQPVRTGTWQFTAVRVLDNPSSEVMTADELESFFYVILYNALRYLRHTCANVQLAMFDYFDAYDYEDGRYRCGGHKRYSMKDGSLPEVCGEMYEWLDDADDETRHPINVFIGTLLIWFQSRYATLTTAAKTKNTISAVKAPKISNEVRELAQKLEDHTAMLHLIDESLAHDWPVLDKLGDLIQYPALAHMRQRRQVPMNPAPADVSSDEESSPCPSGGSDDEPQVKRRRRNTKRHKKSKSRLPVVKEEDEVLRQLGDPDPSTELRPTVTQSRTRGGRRTRAAGRAGSGSSSRNPLT